MSKPDDIPVGRDTLSPSAVDPQCLEWTDLVFDLIRGIGDPEKEESLEELNVVRCDWYQALGSLGSLAYIYPSRALDRELQPSSCTYNVLKLLDHKLGGSLSLKALINL